MSWGFYSKEGKLLYDVVAGSIGDAATLGGVGPSGYVRIGAPGLNSGDVDIDGTLTLPLNNVVADTVLDATYRTVLVNSAAAPRLITLPAAPLTGQIYEIRDQGSTGVGNSATNNITIDPNGNNIDGSGANLVLNQNGAGIIIAYNGFNWVTLADRTISGGAIDADTLDGIDSLQFLRSDVADTAAGSITFNEITQFDKSTYGPVDTTNVNLLLDNTHRTVLVDLNGAPKTITLPATGVLGQWYEIVDGLGGATANDITIDRNGGTINNLSADIIMDTNYDAVVLVCTSGGLAPDWSIVSWRYPATGPSSLALDDLTDVDVTTTPPTEGELLRFDTPGNLWINTPDVTVADTGRLHLKENGSGTGLRIGENSGAGEEVDIWLSDPNTVQIDGRTKFNGTTNNRLRSLENGVSPPGDTYDVETPDDSVLVVKTLSGDMFVRLPSTLNTAFTPMSGDTITLKDAEGNANAVSLAFVAEGVRKRNLPQLTLDTPVGVTDATTTPTPGGVGVDEIQNFAVTGSGTYNINFDGQITAGLTELSTALQVETAINALSPHPNYGYFSVSVSGVDALGGLNVTFDGGSLIDGEAYYYLSVPWQSSQVICVPSLDGNWFLI